LITKNKKHAVVFLTALAAATGSLSATAAERTACHYWPPGNVVPDMSGPLLFSGTPESFFSPFNARDGIFLRPGVCPKVLRTWHQAGPFVTKRTDHDYATNFYERTFSDHFSPSADGSCITTHSKFTLDEAGYGTGSGVICATEFNGPTISVESLQVKVGKRAFVRAKIMRNGAPHRGSVKLELQVQPGSGRLDPDCALGVNSNSEGIAECGYTAPDKPIVETVIAKAYDEETRGTITVTPPSIVVGFFNGV